MGDRIHVIGRSRIFSVRVNKNTPCFGRRRTGSGPSVVVKGQTLDNVVDDIMTGLNEKTQPALVAGDIMSTPVKTIAKHISMEELVG